MESEKKKKTELAVRQRLFRAKQRIAKLESALDALVRAGAQGNADDYGHAERKAIAVLGVRR